MIAPPILALFGGIGWTEVLIIVLVAVLVFGNRLPELGKSLGKGLREFKTGLTGPNDQNDQENTQTPDENSPQNKT